MTGLLVIVGLTAIVAAVSAASRRYGVLAPIALVVVGLGLSFVPGFPEIHIEPEFVLVGVLPPLLYVAALETSVPAFRVNLRPILLLAVGLVIFTAVIVGVVTHLLLPDVPLAICLALGAVVAPPDAIAATAVARRIGLPRRLVTILEGESLLNDATALVLFKVTVAAAIGTAVGPLAVSKEVLLSAGGGVLVGAIGAVVTGYLHRRTKDPLLDNTISVLAPFIVAAVAERLHASAVVAVVVTGLYLGHRLTTLMSAASRLQMGAFWRVVKFLLEGLVFLLVGLQLREVLAALHTPVGTAVGVTVAVLLTVVLTRFAWMYPATYLARLVTGVRRRDPAPSWRVPTLLSWAGMRGVVTLATALALPTALAGGAPYPRDLFVWLAFAVIMVTLVLQGMTLPAMARALRIPPDDRTQDVLAEATVQQAASRAALVKLEEHADSAPEYVVQRLRGLAEQRTNTAWERLGTNRETPSGAYVRLRRIMLEAERDVFRRARDDGRIPEEVLVRAQRELDLEESMLERTEEE
ncbi:Na+/H+ antiporter [Luedemannella helvata]|uniref:Na+/H+ antiporter n=1 Tax=Luedemannella helvata TaxID=349315 RepID=UPI0031E00490